jgi:parvulin-like peptidyl-prolyl isomerase
MVGNTHILQSQLNLAVEASQVLQGVHLDRSSAATRSQAITLAEQQVVINWALSHHVTTTAQAYQAASKLIQTQIVPQLGGQAAFNRRLAGNNLTAADFQQYVTNQVIIQKTFDQVTAKVSLPSTATAQQYYLNNQAFYVSPPEVLVRNITVPTMSEAQSVMAQLKGGASFAALAARDSQDPDKAQGGSRGWVQIGASSALPTAWLPTVTSLKPGQMSIGKDALGYSIIEVQASRAGATIPFHAVQPAIQAELQQTAKEKAFDAWSQSLVHHQNVHLVNLG